jgi:hypothetical protein
MIFVSQRAAAMGGDAGAARRDHPWLGKVPPITGTGLHVGRAALRATVDLNRIDPTR